MNPQRRKLKAIDGFFTDPRLRFSWNITDFREDGSLDIQLDFEKIYEISMTNINPDYLEIIFWNADLFKSKSGR